MTEKSARPGFSLLNVCRRSNRAFRLRWLTGAALCAVPLSLTCTTAFAQIASSTDGAIIGTVTDSSGALIPGAKVKLVGAKVMGMTQTITGSDGQYRFTALQPGDYSVTAEMPGFSASEVKDVTIGLGFTASVNMKLQAGSVGQVISVSSAGTAIDSESTSVSTRLDTDALKELPGSRDFWAVIAQAPAVSITRVDVGGSNALTQQTSVTYGLTSGSGVNRGMVEGVMVNEGAGGSSEMYYTDYGALAEMSVNAAGNTAEMPNPGALTQLVVKTGGNQYHGDVYYDYESDAFESADIDANDIRLGLTGSNVLSVYDTNRISKFSDFNADLGGFIKKDKLWWYFAYRYTSVAQRYPTLLDDTQKTTSPVFTGKMTYNINSKQKLSGFYQHSAKVQPDYLGAILISGGRQSPALMMANTVWHSTFPTYVWKAEYDYIIRPNLLFEGRVGQYHSDWTRVYKSSDARIEDTSTNYVAGGVYNSENNRSRPQFSGTLSYVKDGWFGRHSFKFGGEYMRDTITNPAGQFGNNCNCLSQLSSGAPSNVYIYQPNTSKDGNSTIGIYGTDTWAINRRVNVTLGVRWDENNIFLPAQTGPSGQQFAAVGSALRFNNVGPRVGFDFDVFGNHKTVLKGSFGQFFIYPGSDYANNVNPNPEGGWYNEYQWNATTIAAGGGTACSGDVPTCHWDGNYAELSAKPIATVGGAASRINNPNLKNTYSLQSTMFLEHELAPNFTVRTGFVWNGRRDVAANIYPLRPFSNYTVAKTIKDPGPDGVYGTADDGQTYTLYDLPTTGSTAATATTAAQFTNVPASSNYYNWEISANKHGRGHWDLLASYAKVWAYETTLGGTTAFTPNAAINAPGFVNAYTNWQAKLNLTYRAKYGIRLTPVLRVQSGTPFGRTFSSSILATESKAAPAVYGTALTYGTVAILAEPYNAERTPTIAPVDTRIEKAFTFRDKLHLTAMGDVYNIFNTNAIQATTVTSGTSFMRPVAITGPRVGRIGFKFEF